MLRIGMLTSGGDCHSQGVHVIKYAVFIPSAHMLILLIVMQPNAILVTPIPGFSSVLKEIGNGAGQRLIHKYNSQ